MECLSILDLHHICDQLFRQKLTSLLAFIPCFFPEVALYLYMFCFPEGGAAMFYIEALSAGLKAFITSFSYY